MTKGHLWITERGTTALMVEAPRELRGKKDEAIAQLEAENAALRAELAALGAVQGEDIALLRAELTRLGEPRGPTTAIAEQ